MRQSRSLFLLFFVTEEIYAGLIRLCDEAVIFDIIRVALQKEPALPQIVPAGCLELHGIHRVRADDEKPFALGPAFIHKELVAERIVLTERTVAHDRQLVPETERLAIEVQQRVGVILLRGNVDLLVVLVDRKPRRAGRKPGVRGIAPLHGRARAVARAPVDALPCASFRICAWRSGGTG